MIRSVVPCDRVVGQVHYADVPFPGRCPGPVRVGVYGPGAMVYEVTRCIDARGHAGPCAPELSAADRRRWPPTRTFCELPMRDAQVWVPFSISPGDRICAACVERLPPARGRPVGSEVRFYYDHRLGNGPEVGDALVTDSGKTYLLTAARLVTRGANAGRRTNLCGVVVAGVGDLPEGTVVHELVWYKRERRRPRR